jgi:hypothetical protein
MVTILLAIVSPFSRCLEIEFIPCSCKFFFRIPATYQEYASRTGGTPGKA